jgi:hypothetical protein
MTRSRKILALLGMMLVLALAGCVRFQADLSVDDRSLLDGDIVVAVITNDEPESATNARDAAADIEARLLPALRGSDGVTATPYEQDDYVGTRFSLDNTPLAALDGGGSEGALRLSRTGDQYEFSGTLDFTPGEETENAEVDGDPGDSDISVSIGFPGEVLDHNGELDGTRVTWTTTLEGSVDMHATASAVAPPVSVQQVLLILAAIVLPLAVIVLVAVLLVRRHRARRAG